MVSTILVPSSYYGIDQVDELMGISRKKLREKDSAVSRHVSPVAARNLSGEETIDFE